jgi:hypothetical protein
MTTSPGDRPARSAPDPPRRSYEKPRLTDYGTVSKLTLTGGITTRDLGAMKRRCL